MKAGNDNGNGLELWNRIGIGYPRTGSTGPE
jgi:hypothetical protein